MSAGDVTVHFVNIIKDPRRTQDGERLLYFDDSKTTLLKLLTNVDTSRAYTETDVFIVNIDEASTREIRMALRAIERALSETHVRSETRITQQNERCVVFVRRDQTHNVHVILNDPYENYGDEDFDTDDDYDTRLLVNFSANLARRRSRAPRARVLFHAYNMPEFAIMPCSVCIRGDISPSTRYIKYTFHRAPSIRLQCH